MNLTNYNNGAIICMKKISNELVRYDKVLKLKKKILKEIEAELRIIKTEMSVNNTNDDF